MARDLFTNQASTTVAASKTAPAAGTTESWTVASSSAFPSASNATIPPTQFYVADPAAPTELILVTNVSGTTWSVTRGADGTTPVTHSAGFTIKNVVPAKWLQRLEDRLKKDEFNVLDFGAVGDDSTDCYAGIQAALNAARDAGGGTVYIPKGNYRFQTTPFKIYEGTHIIAHPQAHIKNYAGTPASMFWNGTGGDAPTGYAGNGNITIEGGIWDQRGDAVGGAACFSFAHGKNLTWRNVTVRDVRGTHAIEINGCQTVRIVNCTFEGFYDPDPGGPNSREYSEAVQIDLMKGSDYYGAFGAYDNTTCDDILVDGCTFTTSSNASTHEWGRGVGSHNGTIGKWHTNIRVVNCYFNVKHEAVRAYSWNRTVVANNVMVDGSLGITMEPIAYNGTPSEMTKDANGVQQNTSQNFQDFSITGNVIYGSQAGETNQPVIYVACEDTGRGLNGVISGNTVTDCGDDGICAEWGENINIVGNTVFSAGAYGIKTEDCVYSRISDNNVREGNDGIGVFDCQQMQITNNAIHNPDRHGIYTSFVDDSVVSYNYVYGANNNNESGNAYNNDTGGSVNLSFVHNTARLGSTSYVRAMSLGSGSGGITSVYYIKGCDFEAGSSGYVSLSGTVHGGDVLALPYLASPTLNATGTKVNEVIAHEDGHIVGMQWRPGTSITTLVARPSINGGSADGTTSNVNATNVVSSSQNVPFNKGDRIGFRVHTAGSAASSNLLCTYNVIYFGPDL